MKLHFFTTIILVLGLCTAGCNRSMTYIPLNEQPTQQEEDSSMVIADCAKHEGSVMKIHMNNGSSTTSPIPGDAGKLWLQSLDNKITRVWIQLVFVYNNGNLNYNYAYSGSGVRVEDALGFYSETSDQLMIVLSGHKKSGTFNMPTGEAYVNLVKDVVTYYKRKYPKIKYIQVSNEPDAGGETMLTYYPVYQYYYKGINEANLLLQAEDINYDPVLVGNGAFTSNVTNMLNYADGFLKAYAADGTAGKKFDFFSFNSYGEANRPKELERAGPRIDSAMEANGLPEIPVYVSEYGIQGGSGLPSGLTLAQTMVLQAPGQLTKAYYLYKGGIKGVLNWVVHHSSIPYKSELLDPENGYPSPYGNALTLSKMLSDLTVQINTVSKGIDPVGLGVHALGAGINQKGIAVLVWNYNWRTIVPAQTIQVMIKNIPVSLAVSQNMQCKVYTVDADHNNYYNNPSQTSLSVTSQYDIPYRSYIMVPLALQSSAVSLIVLTPA